MSYQAIARKWRPRSFEAIAGQSHVTRTLRNAIALGRIHHAFLFTGARGVGKTTAARVLARCLNCERGPTPDPCGTCPSCTDIQNGSSPDVIEIDGASNNSVDDIRDLRDSVRYLPVRGKYKVYIVDEVHMLSKGAFNALLKTLEEPPPHVVFIFATTESQKIPETILSRVQRFDFKRIPLTVVTTTLKQICDAEGVKIPEAGLRLIARAGEGSMRDAQSLLDQVISFGGNDVSTEVVAEILGLVDRNLLFSMIEGMLAGQADPCLEAIDKVYQYGYELSEFTSEMLELLRNATLVGLSPSSKRYLDIADEDRARLEAIVAGVPPEVLVQSFQIMLEVHDQVARSTRPRLVLEMAVARLVSVRPARPLDQIVERLADMERRLRHGGAAPPPAGRGPGSSGSPPAGSGPSGPPPRSGPPPSPTRAAEAAPTAPVPAPVIAVPLVETPARAPTPEPIRVRAPQDGPDADQRFRQLQDWLAERGGLYEQWVEDAIFLRASPPELAVAFPDARVLRLAQQILNEPEPVEVLRDGISRFFPGCERARADVRPEGSLLRSRREIKAAARAARLEEVRGEIEVHPVIRRVRDLLGAEIESVTLGAGP